MLCRRSLAVLSLASLVCISLLADLRAAEPAKPKTRPYHLKSNNLKSQILWGVEVRQPEGKGLAFGGQDQKADDGRAGTRILVDGQWQAIGEQLRKNNPLQSVHTRVWAVRNLAKDTLALARREYFQGRTPEEQAAWFKKELQPKINDLSLELTGLKPELAGFSGDAYSTQQADVAGQYLTQAWARLQTAQLRRVFSNETLISLRQMQIELEKAAEALGAEPPPRALDCGPPRDINDGRPAPQPLVYEPKSGLYVLFAGDHLDYLTNDTWVFNPAKPRWEQRHCKDGAPPPRANHHLEVQADGRIKFAGGYTYRSSTSYTDYQYLDLEDGEWLYDIAANRWTGSAEQKLVPDDSRTYRTGPYLPEYFFVAPKVIDPKVKPPLPELETPDAAKFAKWLDQIPSNRWVRTNPPRLPRLNRDWGAARVNPKGDGLLFWSGGHSAHGGSDVLHFHFATNRWELAYPVEFPLGQLYTNTEYPAGFNFNGRPWPTGHTYQNYEVDHATGKLIFAGQQTHSYRYDPVKADWIDRAPKPKEMIYLDCFYNLTLVNTPRGVACWGMNGKIHFWDDKAGVWNELKLTGDKLRGAATDYSSITYDSKRNRLVTVGSTAYSKPCDGIVFSIDIATGEVKKIVPPSAEPFAKFARCDIAVYDPASDLVLVTTHFKDQGDVTRMPAFDCATNSWVTLDVQYDITREDKRVRREYPHDQACGAMYDPKRKLFWGTDAACRVYVLRFDAKTADKQPLK